MYQDLFSATMSREDYVSAVYQNILQRRVRFVFYGLVVVLGLVWGVDFMLRALSMEIMRIRMWSTSVLIILFAINKYKKSLCAQNFVVVIATFTLALESALVAVDAGGIMSPYYEWIFIIIAVAVYVVPIDFVVSLVVILVAMATHTLTFYYFDPSSFLVNRHVLAVHGLELATLSVMMLVGKHGHHQHFIRQLEMQYDICHEQLKLKTQVESTTQRLEKSEMWYKALFDQSTDGIIVLDTDGNIVNVNKKTLYMYGYNDEKEMLGVNVKSLVADNPNAAEDRLKKVMEGNQLMFEAVHRKKDGSHFTVEIGTRSMELGKEQIIPVFIRDVTERKKLEMKLLANQKLDSISTLAGGIAHDFRNVITAVLAYIDSVQTGRMSVEKIGKRSELLKKTLNDATSMITQLLGFARKSGFTREAVDLNDVVKSSTKLFEMILQKKVHIDIVLGENLPHIDGDKNQMQNVVLNLLTNSRDAIGDREDGIIGIRTYVANSRENGKKVILEVSDNGCGMPLDIRAKMFDPYFTTKAQTGGVGLGLSMVHGVVSGAGGKIAVETLEGAGTTFRLMFNLSSEKAVETGSGGSATAETLRGSGKVLLVDDVETVLVFTKDMLESNGYDVQEEISSLKALDKYKDNPEAFDIVITDVVMPDMDGIELAGKIRDINPRARIILLSAYTKYAEHEKDAYKYRFIQKPYEKETLLKAVQDMLHTG